LNTPKALAEAQKYTNITASVFADNKMVTGYADGLICHWEMEISEKGFQIHLVKPWIGHLNKINQVLIRNNQVFSFSNDCTARIWDLPTGTCARVLKYADPIMCGLIDETRDFLFTGSWDRTVTALDLKTNEIDKQFVGSRDSIRCLHLF
jgi:WD40 repeat protein